LWHPPQAWRELLLEQGLELAQLSVAPPEFAPPEPVAWVGPSERVPALVLPERLESELERQKLLKVQAQWMQLSNA
jgi:hypothetical protein